MKVSSSIAIIGAGLAGITAARVLAQKTRVTVFEKSRGFGGRMATRKNSPFQFNHGAQFFTARTQEFKNALADSIDSGLVIDWMPKVMTLDPEAKPFKREWFEPHYVAVPGMNALIKSLASGLDVRLQSEVAHVTQTETAWLLTDNDGNELGEFDWVISAVPAPQCLSLFPNSFSEHETMRSVSFSPCFALMLGFEQELQLNFDAAVVQNSPIAWMVANTDKDPDKTVSSLLIHSDNQWALEKMDQTPDSIRSELLAALKTLFNEIFVEPTHIDLHRWRYAKTESALNSGALVDFQQRLAACGDWCAGNRVEDAFTSGLAAAEQISRDL